MLSEKGIKERARKIKKHLIAGKKIEDFKNPHAEFQFMRLHPNEFEDLVFIKVRDIIDAEELKCKR